MPTITHRFYTMGLVDSGARACIPLCADAPSHGRLPGSALPRLASCAVTAVPPPQHWSPRILPSAAACAWTPGGEMRSGDLGWLTVIKCLGEPLVVRCVVLALGA